MNKLEEVINHYTKGRDLTSFIADLVDGQSLDEEGLWRAVNSTLESMVATIIERSVVDEFRRLKKLGGESDLEFLTRAHLIFQTIGQLNGERYCVSIVLGNLTSKWKDKIVESYEVNTLRFDNPWELFKKKERQDEY